MRSIEATARTSASSPPQAARASAIACAIVVAGVPRSQPSPSASGGAMFAGGVVMPADGR
ncbi:MAG: hypothetical protein V5B34_09820 [Accumulibacter sp.]